MTQYPYVLFHSFLWHRSVLTFMSDVAEDMSSVSPFFDLRALSRVRTTILPRMSISFQFVIIFFHSTSPFGHLSTLLHVLALLSHTFQELCWLAPMVYLHYLCLACWCVHVCVCGYVGVCGCVRVTVCAFVRVCVRACVFAVSYVHVSMCQRVCGFVGLRVYMSICMCVGVCACVYVCVCVCVWMCFYVCACMRVAAGGKGLRLASWYCYRPNRAVAGSALQVCLHPARRGRAYGGGLYVCLFTRVFVSGLRPFPCPLQKADTIALCIYMVCVHVHM